MVWFSQKTKNHYGVSLVQVSKTRIIQKSKMSKFFMMVKVDEKDKKNAEGSPENKKTKPTSMDKALDPVNFSAWMKDKMNLSPSKKKEIEELEIKLETGKSQKTLE